MMQLYLARLVFIVLAALNIYLFTAVRSDYGYTLAALVLICSFIPISFVTGQNKSLRIVKYYLYGFIRFRYIITRDNEPQIVDFAADNHADLGHADGDLTQLIMEYTAKPGSVQRNIILSYINNKGHKQKLRLRLNKSKFETLKSFINP